MRNNLIIDTDSYKASHFLQYPPGTTSMFSYLESRGGRWDQTLFFGLQYILKEYFSKPVTTEDVDEAKAFFAAHGVPFPEAGWRRIVANGGKLPVRIRAVPEGTMVPTHNVLMTIESLDPETFWIGGWIETMLMRVWYPITVATQSWHIKKLIYGHLMATGDDPENEINFKLHDFGSRGVSSRESAGIGGMAHLTNFMGSDTCEGVRFANHYYREAMAAFSIPATEHSTMTAWGREGQNDACRNMLKQFGGPGKLVAVVSDSYDLWKQVEEWGTTLKDEVIKSGATIVIRPDSGHPASIVLNVMLKLDSLVGCTVNRTGYRVLPPYFRVIQGDGVNIDSIGEILQVLKDAKYSASNIGFGMGGALLQQVNRDTQRFAYKCSEVTINGKSVPVFKDPVTDPGKASKRGRLDLTWIPGKGFQTVNGSAGEKTALMLAYDNGEVLTDFSLKGIRDGAHGSMLGQIIAPSSKVA